MPTREEQEKEWIRVIKAAGGLPIGGFGSTGIDIRLTGDHWSRHYEDLYAPNDDTAFSRWLKDLSPAHVE